MSLVLDGVQEFSTKRGRGNEFTPTEAGEGSLALKNRDGTYDPLNLASPLAASLVPLQRVKISWPHPFTAVNYDIFTGYVEEWNPKRILATGSQAIVPLTDGFELLTQAQASPDTALFYAAQHGDARVHAALDDVGWPSTLRRIATLNINVPGMTYPAGTAALEVVQDVVWAEFPGVANVFMDKSGNLAVSGRGIRFGITPNAPWVSYPTWVKLWRVGDEAACALDPTLLPIFGMDWSKGKEGLYNDVVCAPRNASASAIAGNHVVNQPSIDQFGRRSLSHLDLAMLDGSTSGNSALEECLVIANYYRNNYSTPQPRIKSMVFHGQMDDGDTALQGVLWDFILNVEINHVLEVHTENPGGGGFVPNLATKAGYFFVEGITNDVKGLNDRVPDWVMGLDLSPMARFSSYP